MRALKFITGHVIFKLRYNQIYQMKTTIVNFVLFSVTKLKATKVHGFVLVVLYIILLTTSIVIELS